MKFPGVLPIMAFTGRLRPKGGTLFELQVYERVGILLNEIYERVGKSVVISIVFPGRG